MAAVSEAVVALFFLRRLARGRLVAAAAGAIDLYGLVLGQFTHVLSSLRVVTVRTCQMHQTSLKGYAQ